MPGDDMREASVRDLVPRGVAVALAAAVGLHLAAFPRHLEEGAGVASFFLVTAIAQLGAATVVQRGIGSRGRLVLAAGNLGLVVLWALSRRVDLPGAGHGGGPEPVGLLDALAVAAEAAVVVGLLARPALRASVSAARAWPALALTAFLVCGAAMQWTPPTRAHGAHDSPSTPVATLVPTPAVDALTFPPSAEASEAGSGGSCPHGSACHVPHGPGDHSHAPSP